jgi:hypothetical protein
MLFLGMIYGFLTLSLFFIIIRAVAFFKRRFLEKKKLDEIRERWGQPKYTYRDFKLIAAYLTAFGGEYAASTADLDLDDVF